MSDIGISSGLRVIASTVEGIASGIGKLKDKTVSLFPKFPSIATIKQLFSGKASKTNFSPSPSSSPAQTPVHAQREPPPEKKLPPAENPIIPKQPESTKNQKGDLSIFQPVIPPSVKKTETAAVPQERPTVASQEPKYALNSPLRDEESDKLRSDPNNYGEIGRTRAEQMLLGREDGTYMIREQKETSKMVLSYVNEGKVKHAFINNNNKIEGYKHCLTNNVRDLNKASAKEKFQRAASRAKQMNKGVSQGAKPMAQSYHVEVIDNQNRYGRVANHFLETWKQSSSKDSFNDWMSKFEGGNIQELGLNNDQLDHLRSYGLIDENNVPSKISHVTYMDENQRKDFKLNIENGQLSTQHEGKLNTGSAPHIFVVAPNSRVYVGEYHQGTLNHSSFLSGGAVKAAGEMVIENGKLTTITDKSGHYQTSPEMVINGLKVLKSQGVDLSDVTLIMNAHPHSTNPPVKHNASDYLESAVFHEKLQNEDNYVGSMDTAKAKEALKNSPPGSWIIRYSENQGMYICTKKMTDNTFENKFITPDIKSIQFIKDSMNAV